MEGLESDRGLQGERLRTEYSFEDGESWEGRVDAARDQLMRWWYLAVAGLLSMLCLLLCLSFQASLAITLVPLVANDLCILIKTVQRIRSKPREEQIRYHLKSVIENLSSVLFKCLIAIYLSAKPYPLWISAGPLLADTLFQVIYRGRLQVDCSAFSDLVRFTVVSSSFEDIKNSIYDHN